jgi:hypothetical protein
MSDTIDGDLFEAPKTELAVLPVSALPTILAVYKTNILGRLKAELDGWEADATTPKGRAEIGSKVQKVRVARADFKRLADSLKEDAIKTQRAVNAEFKILDERMEGLIEEINARRAEYEAAEAARIKGNKDAIEAMEALVVGLVDLSPDEIQARAASIQSFDYSVEFRDRAEKARVSVLAQLRVAYSDAVQRIADVEAERVRLAEETECQRLADIEARRVREEEIARAAAERARIDAEAEAERLRVAAAAEAQRLLDEAAAREREQAEAAERERREAEQRLAQAEQRRQEAIAAGERARLAVEERERLVAAETERRRVQAAEQAERDRLAAVEAERQRVARETEAQRLADEKRAADKAHRGQINRAVLTDLMAILNDNWKPEDMLSPEVLARKIVEEIAKGHVRHTRITY